MDVRVSGCGVTAKARWLRWGGVKQAQHLRRSRIKVNCGRVGAAALGVRAVRAFAGGVIVEVEG